MKVLLNAIRFSAILSVAIIACISVTKPAQATLKNTFVFVDENGAGAGRVPGGTITGEITFNSIDFGFSGFSSPDSLIVTSLPSWLETQWGDSFGFELNENLLDLPGIRFPDGRSNLQISDGVITRGNLWVEIGSGSSQERFKLRNSHIIVSDGNTVESSGINYRGGFFALDRNRSSLTFAQSPTAVPEGSSSLGILILGGVFSVSGYQKIRKANKLLKDN